MNKELAKTIKERHDNNPSCYAKMAVSPFDGVVCFWDAALKKASILLSAVPREGKITLVVHPRGLADLRKFSRDSFEQCEDPELIYLGYWGELSLPSGELPIFLFDDQDERFMDFCGERAVVRVQRFEERIFP